jgi:hypothetical protein
MAKNEDINVIITALNKAGAEDRFAADYGEKILSLLNELKEWRETGTSRESWSHRVIVEGHSTKSMDDAFADAMHKASHYFSEYHDVSFTVLGLLDLPKGGHRATIEIHITPIVLKDTRKREGQDVELKHLQQRDQRQRKKHEEEHLKNLVYDHFVTTTGDPAHSVPDYFLINIKDADLLNYMIEKSFFKAGRPTLPQPSAPTPSKVVVRINRGKKPKPTDDLD